MEPMTKTARKTSKERTALDRLLDPLGASLDQVSGSRMRLTIPRSTPAVTMELEGSTPRLLAFAVMVARDGGMEMEDVARVTGYVGPVTMVGLSGPDVQRLLYLAKTRRELRP